MPDHRDRGLSLPFGGGSGSGGGSGGGGASNSSSSVPSGAGAGASPFGSGSTTSILPQLHPNLGMHMAAATGNVGLIKYAFEHGQPVSSVLNGLLPLHAAASGGSETAVRLLLSYGADPNAAKPSHASLVAAAAEVQAATAAGGAGGGSGTGSTGPGLLSSVTAGGGGGGGSGSSSSGAAGLVSTTAGLLFAAGVGGGSSSASGAAGSANAGISSILSGGSGVAGGAATSAAAAAAASSTGGPGLGTEGSTPLHFAAANGHLDIIKVLLLHGARLDARDVDGNTPEALAAGNYHDDCVELMHAWLASPQGQEQQQQQLAQRLQQQQQQQQVLQQQQAAAAAPSRNRKASSSTSSNPTSRLLAGSSSTGPASSSRFRKDSSASSASGSQALAGGLRSQRSVDQLNALTNGGGGSNATGSGSSAGGSASKGSLFGRRTASTSTAGGASIKASSSIPNLKASFFGNSNSSNGSSSNNASNNSIQPGPPLSYVQSNDSKKLPPIPAEAHDQARAPSPAASVESSGSASEIGFASSRTPPLPLAFAQATGTSLGAAADSLGAEGMTSASSAGAPAISSKRRPSLPSIFEKAVHHPAQTIRHALSSQSSNHSLRQQASTGAAAGSGPASAAAAAAAAAAARTDPIEELDGEEHSRARGGGSLSGRMQRGPGPGKRALNIIRKATGSSTSSSSAVPASRSQAAPSREQQASLSETHTPRASTEVDQQLAAALASSYLHQAPGRVSMSDVRYGPVQVSSAPHTQTSFIIPPYPTGSTATPSAPSRRATDDASPRTRTSPSPKASQSSIGSLQRSERPRQGSGSNAAAPPGAYPLNSEAHRDRASSSGSEPSRRGLTTSASSSALPRAQQQSDGQDDEEEHRETLVRGEVSHARSPRPPGSQRSQRSHSDVDSLAGSVHPAILARRKASMGSLSGASFASSQQQHQGPVPAPLTLQQYLDNASSGKLSPNPSPRSRTFPVHGDDNASVASSGPRPFRSNSGAGSIISNKASTSSLRSIPFTAAEHAQAIIRGSGEESGSSAHHSSAADHSTSEFGGRSSLAAQLAAYGEALAQERKQKSLFASDGSTKPSKAAVLGASFLPSVREDINGQSGDRRPQTENGVGARTHSSAMPGMTRSSSSHDSLGRSARAGPALKELLLGESHKSS